MRCETMVGRRFGFVTVPCLCLWRSRVQAEEMRSCGGTSVESNGSSTESRAPMFRSGDGLFTADWTGDAMRLEDWPNSARPSWTALQSWPWPWPSNCLVNGMRWWAAAALAAPRNVTSMAHAPLSPRHHHQHHHHHDRQLGGPSHALTADIILAHALCR